MTSLPEIAFDVTPATLWSTGVARYCLELGSALERAGVILRRYAIGRGSRSAPVGTRRSRLPVRLVHPAWATLHWPKAEALAGGGGLVHATDFRAPPSRHPVVATVHDLVAVARPELHPARAVRLQRRQLAGLGRVAAVIADSRATADELVRRGLPANRVDVVYPGVTALGVPVPVTGVRSPFVLAVGALHRRKGVDVLLEAFAGRADTLGALVITGPDAGQGGTVKARAAALGIASRVVCTGTVTDGQLAWLYSQASVLAFPSRGEGFGLPVVEAQAAGLPVVAADLPVLREVAGEAALFVPTDDPTALATAITAAAADSATRSSLIDAGRHRAGGFTWEAAAQATIACYERVLACA